MRFEFFWQRRFYPNRIRQRAAVQDATSAMNKQIGEWSRSFIQKGNEGLIPLPGFIPIKINIVMRHSFRDTTDRQHQMKSARRDIILSCALAALALAFFGVPAIISLASLTSSFTQIYLSAWLVLLVGTLLCLWDPHTFVSDRTGMAAIFEVRMGFGLLLLSVFIATGLFAITGYRELNLPNYLTALSCVFGILVGFYFLYLVPRKSKKRNVLKELMSLPGVGKVYAERFYNSGILTEQDLVHACRSEGGINHVSNLTGVPANVIEIATQARIEPKMGRDVGA